MYCFRATARLSLALAGLTALGGCAGSISGDPHLASSSVITGDYAVPVASFEARRFNTVVHQQYDFSCGSAALATLLRYHYNDPQTEEAVFQGMWRDGDRDQIKKVGFSLLDMKRYLASRGLLADGYKVKLADIEKRRIPGIALITVKQYRHFVVVKGVSYGKVLLGDPSLGLRTVSAAEFEKSWNGVYFVINNNLDQAHRSFNVDAQWASFAKAPTNGLFLDPLSIQALALTAPFYRDF